MWTKLCLIYVWKTSSTLVLRERIKKKKGKLWFHSFLFSSFVFLPRNQLHLAATNLWTLRQTTERCVFIKHVCDGSCRVKFNCDILLPPESPSEQRAARSPFIFFIPYSASGFHTSAFCHLTFKLSLVHVKQNKLSHSKDEFGLKCLGWRPKPKKKIIQKI